MDNIKRIISYSEPFDDGQHITSVILEYPESIESTSLNRDCFEVKNRAITNVYANSQPCPLNYSPYSVIAEETQTHNEQVQEGKFVIIELDAKEKNSKILDLFMPPRPEGPPPDHKNRKGGRPSGPRPVRRPVQISVSQNIDLISAQGTVFPSFKDELTTEEINVLEDEFSFGTFDGMEYSLYIPSNADVELYPMVVFVPDAGGVGKGARIGLEESGSGIAFAKPSVQKKHPNLVLIPQYDGESSLTDDDSNVDEIGFERIHQMILNIIEKYPVDPNRVYCTGQSMGTMLFCEMNSRYPDLFAAGLLVAGQWEPSRMSHLGRKPFWMVVSEKDGKACPGMDAIVKVLEADGAVVKRYLWDGGTGKNELNVLASEAMKDDCNVRFTIFKGDSVLPEGWCRDGGWHENSWRVACTVDAFKDWLFAQSK